MLPVEQSFKPFSGLDGKPLSNGSVYFGEPGQDAIAHPVTVYWDTAGTQPASQPLRTVNGYIVNDSGSAANVFVDGSYSQLVLDSKGIQVFYAQTSDDFSIATAVKNFITSLAYKAGASLVGFVQAGVGAVARLVQDKLRETVSVKDFGAVGDNETDDSAAIQAAFDACTPGGEVRFPAGQYKLTTDIRVTKPVHVVGIGPGSYINDLGSYIIQSNTAKAAFTLVATMANYAFGQYGIVDVHFANLAILGNANASRSLVGITVDTTVNGGDFHIRGNSFNNVRIRYFQTACALTGIAYLNNWFGGGISSCGDGVIFKRGGASDVGGQNRFFGWTAVSIDGSCISYFEDTLGGSLGVHGCTLSESGYGIRDNQEVKLYTSPDCEFESNANAAIYLQISNGSNPNTSGPKTICGKFLTNGADIWVDKTTTAYPGGGFVWPMKIDDAYLGSAVGLKVTVPAGHFGIDSPAFILGHNVTGPTNGEISPSQISPNFLGTNEKKRRVTREYSFSGDTASGAVLGSLPHGMVVVSVRFYLSANAAGYTGLQIGDQANGSRYAFIDGSTEGLNTWVPWANQVPPLVIDGSNNHLTITGTAGINGAAGVVEVDGYIP